jgi:CRP-like cAMP-binding protein
MKPKSFSAGEYVIRKGEPANEIFVIVSGTARNWSEDGDTLNTLEALYPGQQFALSSVLSGGEYRDTVSALTYLEVLSVQPKTITSCPRSIHSSPET